MTAERGARNAPVRLAARGTSTPLARVPFISEGFYDAVGSRNGDVAPSPALSGRIYPDGRRAPQPSTAYAAGKWDSPQRGQIP